jgi:hypothetical protein
LAFVEYSAGPDEGDQARGVDGGFLVNTSENWTPARWQAFTTARVP